MAGRSRTPTAPIDYIRGVNTPSKKKEFFPISEPFRNYLRKHRRVRKLPLIYNDLLRWDTSFPLIDRNGVDTHWRTVMYHQSEYDELNRSLNSIYALLMADGEKRFTKHLAVDRIDYCEFGNSKPFRVRIINRLNDNYDHFYVKKADASRVYGLELEHIMSPNKMFYLLDGTTLIEAHIPGIPGDVFIKDHLETSDFEKIRIAKEFVKFNERCFVRLLGDMRSYNYVVDVTPDIEGNQYRLRAIDFDQQTYEGRKNFYLPQYFKSNNPIVNLGIEKMTPKTVEQYQYEERSMIAARILTEQTRTLSLLEIMKRDRLSSPEKVRQLADELASHHDDPKFLKARSMGEMVQENIQLLLDKDFRQSSG